MATLAFAAAVAANGAAMDAGQTGCADQSRHAAAYRLAQAINSGEAAAFAGQRSYAQLTDLPVGPVPAGMTAQLSTDGETYAFSVKDTTDACHSAVFSDQAGVIYVGTPIR
jgi:hypothetical protein